MYLTLRRTYTLFSFVLVKSFYFKNSIFFLSDREHDLLRTIKVPFEDPKSMYFDQGIDGFPAYGIIPGCDLKSPYRTSLPERFYAEFSITCTVAIKSAPGGFIFAVVNPSETVRYLKNRIAILPLMKGCFH